MNKKTLIRCLGAAVLLGGCAAASAVLAQGVYRIVGPDGRVTYSDQPPPANAKATQVDAAGAGAGAGAGDTSQLPFELRQAASKYPVTFYSGKDCAPCGNGRNLLSTRGIPFAEKTVTSNEDNQALKRISGENALPFLTIGGQQIKGFSETEWNQFLDAAGYPKQSKLPASYKRPSPAPLVAAARSTAAPTDTKDSSTPERRNRTVNNPVDVPANQPAANNPAGIRF